MNVRLKKKKGAKKPKQRKKKHEMTLPNLKYRIKYSNAESKRLKEVLYNHQKNKLKHNTFFFYEKTKLHGTFPSLRLNGGKNKMRESGKKERRVNFFFKKTRKNNTRICNE